MSPVNALGRSNGYDLKSGADVEFSAIATYDPQTGRLAAVGNGTQALTYGYQPGSHLVQTVTGPVHLATSNWEANREVLASLRVLGTDSWSKRGLNGEVWRRYRPNPLVEPQHEGLGDAAK